MYEIASEFKERILAFVKFSDEKWILEKGMGDDNEGIYLLR